MFEHIVPRVRRPRSSLITLENSALVSPPVKIREVRRAVNTTICYLNKTGAIRSFLTRS
jgi:hypothetical protein